LIPFFSFKSTMVHLSQLPAAHTTSTALALAVRAHAEGGASALCARSADRLAAHEPGCLEAADVASTALWLLGDAPALAALAHRVIAIDKYV
jgi:hypothetical protein